MMLCEQDAVVIPSRLDAAVSTAESIAKSLQPPPPNAFIIQLALHEVLVNAVQHGNQLDPTKQVTIHISHCHQHTATTITVTDQGSGFDWRTTLSELATANPLRENQRGLLIIHKAFGHVSFNETGNQITLRLNRHNSAQEEECKA